MACLPSPNGSWLWHWVCRKIFDAEWQNLYDFSDQYLQNPFGTWGVKLAKCNAKIQKMRIPTINWPHIELSFQKHAHSNSPKTKRSNAIYPTRPIFGSWILFLRKNIKKTNPPLVAFFLRVLIMARPAPNLAAKT